MILAKLILNYYKKIQNELKRCKITEEEKTTKVRRHNTDVKQETARKTKHPKRLKEENLNRHKTLTATTKRRNKI